MYAEHVFLGEFTLCIQQFKCRQKFLDNKVIIVNMGVKSFLQLAVLVLVGAVFLKQLVDWWNASPTYVTSSLLNEDKLKHVPLHGDLQAFIQDFDGPPGQRIIKVTARLIVLVICRHSVYAREIYCFRL